jgi:hypothetical protein
MKQLINNVKFIVYQEQFNMFIFVELSLTKLIYTSDELLNIVFITNV